MTKNTLKGILTCTPKSIETEIALYIYYRYLYKRTNAEILLDYMILESIEFN